MSKKRRPIGHILLDAEKLIDEVIDSHHVQYGDILYWIWGHLKIHRPDAEEEYLDDTHPFFFYGAKECLSDIISKKEKLNASKQKSKRKKRNQTKK